MKDTRLAHAALEPGREEDAPQPIELRSLDDLELALVGGGDGPVEWP